MAKLRLAFVDHELDNFHANTFLSLIRGELAARADVVACHADRAESGRAWATRQGVPWVDDPRDLRGKVDAVAVLAPSNPETHLAQCERVLPLRLPTFVDKTFAPDLATARAIFALADRWGAPVQSSSALRYTEAQRVAAELAPIREMTATGGGSSFAEYAIHPLELAVSVLGHEARTVIRAGTPRRSQLLISFSGGRSAVVNVEVGDAPFSARLAGDRGERTVAIDLARLFADACSAMIDFLADGRPRVDRRETLAIRAILDAAADPASGREPVPLASARSATV
jgi:predicted dehydrogenase